MAGATQVERVTTSQRLHAPSMSRSLCLRRRSGLHSRTVNSPLNATAVMTPACAAASAAVAVPSARRHSRSDPCAVPTATSAPSGRTAMRDSGPGCCPTQNTRDDGASGGERRSYERASGRSSSASVEYSSLLESRWKNSSPPGTLGTSSTCGEERRERSVHQSHAEGPDASMGGLE
jgi:hypothetical protein